MAFNDGNNELRLYYQDKCYSWTELLQQVDSLSPESPYIIPAEPYEEQCFTTILYLLYGFINKKLIFPASAEYLTYPLLMRGEPKESAFAVATSGTQAEPKVVIISRQNIIAHCQRFVKIIPVDTSSVWLNCMPLNHIAGIMIFYRCWFNQASMLLHDDFDVQKVWHDVHTFSVTHISLVPRMLSRLLEYCKNSKPPEHLKYVLVGGDIILNSLFQRAVSAGWPVVISYGMTEATSTIALGSNPNKLIPLDGFDIQLTLDGTLKIKGAMVASRGLATDDWFETNDHVKWDGHYLSIVGRNDDMIISGGQNISPQYVESLLSVATGIDDVAVGKIADDEWGDTIVALVSGQLEQFKTWVKSNVKSVYQPIFFIKLEKIPRNVLGKIDRKAVQILINKHFCK